MEQRFELVGFHNPSQQYPSGEINPVGLLGGDKKLVTVYYHTDGSLYFEEIDENAPYVRLGAVNLSIFDGFDLEKHLIYARSEDSVKMMRRASK